MTGRLIRAGLVWSFFWCGVTGAQDPPPDSIAIQLQRAISLLQQDQPAEAERVIDQVRVRSHQDSFKLGDLSINSYAFVSTLLISTYLRMNEFANAERVAEDRLEWAERRYGAKGLQVAGFLDFAADISRLQSKHAMAEPLYVRSLAIMRSFKLDGCGLNPGLYARLAEVYLALERPKDAQKLLRPAIEACRQEPRGNGHARSALLNAYAVALERDSQGEDAATAALEADQVGTIDPRLQAQDRDFLRGRLLAAEGRFDEAIALSRKWIAGFEAPEGEESDRTLMTPLEECWRLLVLANRPAEAAEVGARLRAIRTRYGIKL